MGVSTWYQTKHGPNPTPLEPYMASSSSSSSAILSPYLLHPSDSPSLILVSSLLTGDNFPKWQKAITRALNAKNKLSFVDGALPTPDSNSPEYKQWNQTKDMVLTWILNSISPSLANSLEYHTNPREVWVDLQSRFSHGNNARLYHLKRALSSLQQNTNSIHEYYNHIKQIWDELSHLQNNTDLKDMQKQADDERVFQFLLGLNDSFAQLRTQILAMEPLPPITKVFSILFQEEQQRLLHIRPQPTESMAFAATNSGTTRSNLRCTECGKTGHTRDRCWRVVGYPPGRDQSSKPRPSLLGKPPSGLPPIANQASFSSESSPVPGLTPELYQKLLDLLTPTTTSSNFVGNATSSLYSFDSHHDWVVDSGASAHMCNDRSLFCDFKPPPPSLSVKLLNGHTLSIKGIGHCKLSQTLTLANVYYIPDFHFNLLSVPQLTNHTNCIVSFSSKNFLFQDPQSMMLIGAGDFCNGLYVYRPNNVLSLSVQSTVNKDLWHRRLGHPSRLLIPQLFTNSHVISDCDICARSKHTRLPFSSSDNKSSFAFNRIFCDIWGGYHTPSICGSHYFLTIVDDFSCTTWLYLMRYKSEAYTNLMHFFALVQNQFNTTVKKIRTDNGQEFLSQKFQSYLHNTALFMNVPALKLRNKMALQSVNTGTS